MNFCISFWDGLFSGALASFRKCKGSGITQLPGDIGGAIWSPKICFFDPQNPQNHRVTQKWPNPNCLQRTWKSIKKHWKAASAGPNPPWPCSFLVSDPCVLLQTLSFDINFLLQNSRSKSHENRSTDWQWCYFEFKTGPEKKCRCWMWMQHPKMVKAWRTGAKWRWDSWRDVGRDAEEMITFLFHWFYHAKSPLNHHLENILKFFQPPWANLS